MARRLFNFCLAWAFVLGCWGGAIAAAACPHVGCVKALAAPERAAAHGAHAAAETHEPAAPEDHCARAAAHHEDAAGPRRVEEPRPEPEGLRGLVSSAHDPSCAHCVGGGQSPPSAKSGWQFESVRKVEKAPATPSARPPAARSRAFVRPVTPPQHAPPSGPGRHLLLSLFLI